jgi:phospholipid/cholesterol/gamma-HCH transport system substrate-binding protein
MRSQQRVKWAQLKVAAVCLVALVILGDVLYLLTGGAIFTEQTKLYLYIPDSTGIEQGSPVRVDGIDVGKVSGVALSGSKDPARVVRLTLTVARDFLPMIPVGSYAELSTDDPVGDKYVDITSSGRGVIPPKSELPYREPSDIFKTLDLSQFQKNLRDMDAILTDIETGRSLVGQFVIGTQMYSDINRRVADIERSLRAAASTTSSLGQELYTDRLYQRITKPVLELDQALARLQSGQGAAGQLLRDSAQYDQAAATIQSVRESIRSIRASPMMQSDTMYTDLTRSVLNVTRSVEQIDTGGLFAAPQAYESWNGMARELEKSMRDFRENPRKYLRLKIF